MNRHLTAYRLATALGMALLPAVARAQSDKATIVYDVALREFTCWREGPLTADAQQDLCSPAQGWHPVTTDLYFVRAQAVSVLLQNAVANDIFSLDVTAEDLPEPGTNVSGAISELPKLVPLVPTPAVIPGTGAVLSSVSASIEADQIYRQLIFSDEKDFVAWLKATFITPLAVKEVQDLLAIDSETALKQLESTGSWITEVNLLATTVRGIADPTDTRSLVAGARALAAQLSTQMALHRRLDASGIVVAGKTVTDALQVVRTLPVRAAREIDSGQLLAFVTEFQTAFPAEFRYRRIGALIRDNGALGLDPKYDDGSPLSDMETFVGRLQSAAGGSVTVEGLARLKKNLTALADSWNELVTAQKRLESLSAAATTLESHQQSDTGVFALQVALNSLADDSISKANQLNAAASGLPLEHALRLLPAGQWFGSKTVKLTLKQGPRIPLFDLSGVAAASTASTTAPTAQKATQTAVTEPSAVRSFQFRIYNLYRVQVGLGSAFSTADDVRYQVNTVTTGNGSTAIVQKFVDQTLERNYNALWTANLIVFPAARHAFPWRPRYAGEKAPGRLSNLGAMLGFSIADPARNALLGGAWFPQRNTIGFQFAWHIAIRDVPAKDTAEPLTERVTLLKSKRFNGFTAGVVVTPDFFAKVVAPIFKP